MKYYLQDYETGEYTEVTQEQYERYHRGMGRHHPFGRPMLVGTYLTVMEEGMSMQELFKRNTGFEFEELESSFVRYLDPAAVVDRFTENREP